MNRPDSWEDPPDDDDEEGGIDASDDFAEPEPDEPCDFAASEAEDRWTAERDRTASQ